MQNQEIISYNDLIEQLTERQRSIECIGFSDSGKAHLIAKIFLQQRLSCLVVASSTKQAEQLIEDLRFFAGDSELPILFFPPYNILPFKFISYHNETAGHRIRVLYQLLEETAPSVVVTTVDALLQKLIPRQAISRYAELVIAGEEIERDYLTSKLISGGYTQSAIVEEPGDFSIRGGIIDIFSPLYPDPLRIEFYGDFVESLRFFSASNQRKLKNINEAVILPAKEVILDKQLLPNILSGIRMLANELEVPVTHTRQVIDKLRNDEMMSGIESLIPLIYPQLDTLFDYIPQNSLIVNLNYEELAKAAAETEERVRSNYASARGEKRLCAAPEELYQKWSRTSEVLLEKKPLVFKTLEVTGSQPTDRACPLQFKATIEDNSDLSMALQNPAERANLFRPLVDWMRDQERSGFTALAVCRTKSQADRLQSLLDAYGLHMKLIKGFSEVQNNRGQLSVCIGQVSGGFVWPAQLLALVTDAEIFGVRPRRRKYTKPRPSAQLLDMQELKQDDLIVHDDHGIGQYGGLVKLKLEGLTNDFLVLVYKGGDKLYLPVDRMSVVQKYMGVDGIKPLLDTLGGKSWEKVQSRVKKSAQKIAGELLKLYARRKIDRGYAFAAPDTYLKEFEAGFAFEETVDQQKAIEDALEDMQNPTPMDRLVCGDVGYGKTEVALRAAFLAVNDGKQVAVLVPTTILAEQHFATFSNRFERYPINVACLSRFRSARLQRDIVNDLKAGKVDIVIGTHRLLQKDIAFNDLGLVVLDEEQRFGVKHKEKLKKFRSSVDVLALTATPIPRALH